MNRRIVISAIGVAAAFSLCIPFTYAKVTQDSTLNGAWKAITELQNQVAQLKQQIASISLIPGPQGPAGPKGDTGEPGAPGSGAGASVHLYDGNGQDLGVFV